MGDLEIRVVDVPDIEVGIGRVSGTLTQREKGDFMIITSEGFQTMKFDVKSGKKILKKLTSGDYIIYVRVGEEAKLIYGPINPNDVYTSQDK